MATDLKKSGTTYLKDVMYISRPNGQFGCNNFDVDLSEDDTEYGTLNFNELNPSTAIFFSVA